MKLLGDIIYYVFGWGLAFAIMASIGAAVAAAWLGWL
tara:strand:- start:1105 stop:1215 length:111 start_codon:yes stop_codon:yes gene_type:complete